MNTTKINEFRKDDKNFKRRQKRSSTKNIIDGGGKYLRREFIMNRKDLLASLIS